MGTAPECEKPTGSNPWASLYGPAVAADKAASASLLPLVDDGERRVRSLADVHGEVDGVVVGHLGHRAVLRRLSVHPRPFAAHGQLLLGFVVGALHQHRAGGHAVDP